MITPKEEKEIHEVFDLTLVLKGIHAAAEVLGGVFLYLASGESIIGIMNFLVQGELQEDPHDLVANYLLHLAQSLGGSSKSFAALYLLGHGILNGAVVVALWKEKLWAYPWSIVVLGAFVLYQCYLLTFGFSAWLAAIAVLDVVIIILVWHEYGVIRAKKFRLRRNQIRQ